MWCTVDWHVGPHSRLIWGAAVPPPRTFAVLCNVRTISVCLVCLWDQIRWISCSMTQMFILVSSLSYVSRRRLKLAVLSGSLALYECCREEWDAGVKSGHLKQACTESFPLGFKFNYYYYSPWPIMTPFPDYNIIFPVFPRHVSFILSRKSLRLRPCVLSILYN